MKIVFDTNIWISHLGLNTNAGAAVRFYIKETGATVVVPEVVRLELEKNLTGELQQLMKNITNSYNKLLTVFGKLKELVLPSDDEINGKASDILDSLDVPIQEIPFSFEAAKSSFLKIIEEQPPSSKKNQQFKDGVIWANCLELLDEADVYLVSEDKGFYKDRDYDKGLALNLLEEAKQYPNQLKLISSLKELLKDIRVDVELDDNNLIEGIYESSGEQINRILDEANFSLGNSPAITKSLFTTENSSQLYMEFEILYDCSDPIDEGRTEALLILQGSGLYETEKEEFQNVSIPYASLKYVDADGLQQSYDFHYLSAHATLGHKTVEHTVRHSLSDS